MSHLKISNWNKWQTYRADRGQPPWIKIHRSLLRNPEWQSMTDAEKGQLVSIWMLAADRNGEIPRNAKMIQKLCGLDSPPNLQSLVNFGFIDSDANVTPERRQCDHPDAESDAEADAEVDSLSGKPDGSTDKKLKLKQDAGEVLDFLNQITGKSFRNTKDIIACLKREKCSVDECKTIIRFKWNEWKGTDMERFVSPTTPFRAKNFAAYLDESGATKPAGHVRPVQKDDWGRVIPQRELDMIADMKKEEAANG